MRLVTFVDPSGAERGGVLVTLGGDDVVRPLLDGQRVDDLVALGLEAALEIGAGLGDQGALPLDAVRLLAPLVPRTIRDFVAFEHHVDGVRRSIERAPGVPEAWYDAPTFYFTNPHTVLGPDVDVPFPASSTARDLELEVAVVVGRAGTSLSVEAAREHVFGCTILNDWSARDLQGREMQVGLGPAKGKDFANSLGPWLVTIDELEEHRDADGFLVLEGTASINGVEIGRDRLSNAGWTLEAMIAHASRDSRVLPGDVLGSGTFGQGGCLAELWGRAGEQVPPPLVDGDVVTLSVTGLGSLTNRVATRPPAPPGAPVRRREPTP